MLLISFPHEEIVRLDIPVQEVPGVEVAYSFEQLFPEHEDRLGREAFVPIDEEFFGAFGEQVHNHEIESGFGAYCIDLDMVRGTWG